MITKVWGRGWDTFVLEPTPGGARVGPGLDTGSLCDKGRVLCDKATKPLWLPSVSLCCGGG